MPKKTRKWKVEVELCDYSNINFFTQKEILVFLLPYWLGINIDSDDCLKIKNCKIRRIK